RLVQAARKCIETPAIKHIKQVFIDAAFSHLYTAGFEYGGICPVRSLPKIDGLQVFKAIDMIKSKLFSLANDENPVAQQPPVERNAYRSGLRFEQIGGGDPDDICRS